MSPQFDEAGRAPGEIAPPALARPRLTPRRILRLASGLPIAAVVLFGAAGRLDWPAAWAYLALMTAALAGVAVILARLQPGLIEERGDRWREGKDWDKPLVLMIAMIGQVLVQLVCGLDERFGWSPPLHPAIPPAAALTMAGGVILAAWALSVNAFFSGIVRIQADRGHVVVAHGPYRYLRHPGYSGSLLTTLATPLLLGSLWGLVPAGLVAVVMLVRTVLEDRTLQAELDGYTAYAARVRYRLVPGIW